MFFISDVLVCLNFFVALAFCRDSVALIRNWNFTFCSKPMYMVNNCLVPSYCKSLYYYFCNWVLWISSRLIIVNNWLVPSYSKALCYYFCNWVLWISSRLIIVNNWLVPSYSKALCYCFCKWVLWTSSRLIVECVIDDHTLKFWTEKYWVFS